MASAGGAGPAPTGWTRSGTIDRCCAAGFAPPIATDRHTASTTRTTRTSFYSQCAAQRTGTADPQVKRGLDCVAPVQHETQFDVLRAGPKEERLLLNGNQMLGLRKDPASGSAFGAAITRRER